jgi:SAM-dependent methyltransferase
MFDFIFSDHVMEHVADYDATLAEMRRVLSPSGIASHIFPSRYRFFESHLKIPFGGVVANPLWFALWQRLGQHRNIFPEGENTSIGSSARRNVNWIRNRTYGCDSWRRKTDS